MNKEGPSEINSECSEIEILQPTQMKGGLYLVVSARRGRELTRDKFDLNLIDRRAKFVRDTMKAAFPGKTKTAWPAGLQERLEKELHQWSVVPPGSPGPSDETACGSVSATESGFAEIDGCTYHCTIQGARIAPKTKLANFVARTVAESVSDDGAEQSRELAISATLAGGCEANACVSVERFNTLDWVVERLGPRFIIQPGKGVTDRLRCAIQEMSPKELPTTVAYRHTGWREINGEWRYLHAPVPGTSDSSMPAWVGSVRLDGAAAHFRLPAPPVGKGRLAAIRSSLAIFDGLVPDRISFPLQATVYRAPLGEADYALWFAGATGTQKSELAALGQQHYGAEMNRGHLPGNWSSTDNALEALAFTTKDAVLVIDDFAPSASRQDADRQHRTAERLIRGQGNHSGRQRMDSKANLRPAKPPRALVVATGEDIPRVHSIAARLAIAEMRPGDVNLARLSQCQLDAAAGLYASSMSAFVAWLAPQFSEVLAAVPGQRIAFRNEFVGDSHTLARRTSWPTCRSVCTTFFDSQQRQEPSRRDTAMNSGNEANGPFSRSLPSSPSTSRPQIPLHGSQR